MAEAVFFDLDGTLTDSGPGILNCARAALEHFGLPVPEDRVLRAFVGPPLRESFPRFGVPEAEVEEAIRVFRARYIPVGKFENSPYPGIRDLLARLQKDGLPLYVATSKPEVTAVEVLEHFGLAGYFTKICGASFHAGRETKAEVLAYLLAQSGPAAGAVMVGDTAYDVLGAKAHGIPAIGVTWGYGSPAELKKAGAQALAETPEALYRLLERKRT